MVFLWEFFELSVDSIFVFADMSGQSGELFWDTLTDLGADITGGLVASFLIYCFFYGYILKKLKR